MLPTPPVAEQSNQSQKPKPRKPRGRGLRTTTGCAICRKRHMKCDEIKPLCGPCAKGNRPCFYVSSSRAAPRGASASVERPAKPRLITSNVLSQSRDSPTYSHRSSHERSPQTQEDLASPSVRGLQRPPQADAIVKRNPSQTAWQVQGDQTTMVHGLHGNSHSLHPRQTILPSSVQDAPSIVFEQAVDSTVSIRMPTQDIRQGLLELPGEDYPTPNYSRVETPPLTRTHSSVAPPLSDASESRERELWRSPVELQDHELALFKTFVEDLSGWLDLFDEKHHFCVDIPQLALTNMGLMRAILAFSARHAAIVHGGSQSFPIDSTAAFQYYSEALNHLQRNMQYASYQKSPDIIATSLIVSAYEMIDGAGKSWDRHLKGVCYMHQAQSNDGASGGMGQAMWWAWVLQDVWAAFRERRGTFGSWTPKKAYIELEPIGVARRAIWLLAQVIDFTSDEEEAPGEADHQSRADRAMNLTAMLDEWERSLPKCFHPLPRRTASSYSFTPLWINPQVFGVATQMHRLARIILLAHLPVSNTYTGLASTQAQMARCIDEVCGIATTITEKSACIISTQCLFGIGFYVRDARRRDEILQLIDEHRARTGWPVASLRDELIAEWTIANS